MDQLTFEHLASRCAAADPDRPETYPRVMIDDPASGLHGAAVPLVAVVPFSFGHEGLPERPYVVRITGSPGAAPSWAGLPGLFMVRGVHPARLCRSCGGHGGAWRPHVRPRAWGRESLLVRTACPNCAGKGWVRQ